MPMLRRAAQIVEYTCLPVGPVCLKLMDNQDAVLFRTLQDQEYPLIWMPCWAQVCLLRSYRPKKYNVLKEKIGCESCDAWLIFQKSCPYPDMQQKNLVSSPSKETQERPERICKELIQSYENTLFHQKLHGSGKLSVFKFLLILGTFFCKYCNLYLANFTYSFKWDILFFLRPSFHRKFPDLVSPIPSL